MISVFIIGIIVVIAFRAIGTSHEDKSAIDRFWEIVRNKQEEKVEPEKKRKLGVTSVYLRRYPMLKKVRDKCNREEKIQIDETCKLINKKKIEIQKEEGTYKEL